MTVNSMDMITMKLVDKCFPGTLESGERVGPVVLRDGSNPLVVSAEVDKFRRNDHHPVFAIAAGQASQSHRTGGCDVINRGSAGRKIEALRTKFDFGKIYGWIETSRGKISGMFSAVAQIPDTQIGVEVAHIGEQDGCGSQLLENLHGECRV